MKNLIITLLLVLLAGCTKTENSPVEVTINISGFNITIDEFSTLKGITEDEFSGFQHYYLAGILTFSSPSGAVYTFSTNLNSIDGFKVTLSPGTYQLSGSSNSGSYAGTSGMSFTIPSQEIIVGEITTSIDITVTPTCGLILVADQNSLIGTAIIRPELPPPSWPFFKDGNFYYTYFQPKNSHYAHLTKKDATYLTMNTVLLKVGYIYKIEVTDGTTGTSFNLNSIFEDAETIVW
jgi:hypothetical protein